MKEGTVDKSVHLFTKVNHFIAGLVLYTMTECLEVHLWLEVERNPQIHIHNERLFS